MSKNIYIIEDDENISEILNYNFVKNGFQAKTFYKGKDFLDFYHKEKPDMVILDLMLPDMDGLDICREVKIKNSIPVIILSAKITEFDKVLGLELGADDYITKPFSLRELLVRVKNVFNRTETLFENEKLKSGDFYFGDIKLYIDEKNHEICLDEAKINLNPKEFEIIRLFIKNLNNLSSRKELMKIIWGVNCLVGTRTLDVHIRRIRNKMSYKDFGTRYIKTVHGLGYKLINSI